MTWRQSKFSVISVQFSVEKEKHSSVEGPFMTHTPGGKSFYLMELLGFSDARRMFFRAGKRSTISSIEHITVGR